MVIGANATALDPECAMNNESGFVMSPSLGHVESSIKDRQTEPEEKRR